MPAHTIDRRTALRAGLLAAAGAAGLSACGSGDATAAAATVAPAASPTGRSHTATRLTSSPKLPYAEVIARFEKTVPPLPAAQLGAAVKTKPYADVKALLAKASPVSLFIFYALDATPFMTKAGHPAKCKTYLIGNPLVAETMYGYNAGVMLYAPLRTAIYTDEAGLAHLSIDRPSDLFGSFDEAHIAATGHTLDQKLAALLTHLKFPVPTELIG
jgi:hypothetical protein